ncbi:MAG TPA: zinc ABC transporter substrate-binding protein [Amnibacterium sp.]|uniref:metal ABC transporter solute-binding protein, Zn/Mn family n=1 Tax=Amnibacterium sp. TaxID=1872496 RepID=UPI002F920A8D
MRTERRRVAAAAGALVAATLLAGCTASSGATTDDRVAVVASTDVWGSVVEAVGAGHVAVTSLIGDPSRDPHEFQASVRDQLAVSRAAIVVENGGGYDDFMRRLASAAHAPVVLDAVRLSGRDAGAQDFNEHVWFDLPTVRRVADAVNTALIRADPGHRADYATALATFHGELGRLQGEESTIRSTAEGRGVAITEPVPLYLTAACGLVDLTPRGFSAAVDDGRDVPPALLQAQLALVRSPRVALLAMNSQTEDPVTDQVVAAAKAAGLPVVGFGETLPQGESFARMFHGELAAVATAVRR